MILELNDLIIIVNSLKERGLKIVLCNGTFDLLHIGHIRHLQEAKCFGDILVVAILNDEDVKLRKGEGRPIFKEDERLELVDSLECVDFTVLNRKKTGIELIKYLKPDIYVKGEDYKDKETSGIISEKESMKQIGGEVKYTTVYNSSRNIIEYIKENC